MIFVSVAMAADLVVWHSYRGAEREALEGLLAAYPGGSVEVLAVPADAYNAKLEAAIPRGNGPDLFVAAHDKSQTWRSLGMIEQDGVALASKSVAVFVNTALVAEPPDTLEELFAVAAAQTGDGRFGLVYENSSAYFHGAWPGGAVDPDRLLSPETLRSFEFLLRAVPYGPEEPTPALVTRLFNEGKAAMVINGPWFVGEIQAGLPWSVVPLPEECQPYLTEEKAWISAQSQHKAEAAALARWLVEPAQAKVRAEVGRQVVATPEVWSELHDPVLSAFAEAARRARPTSSDPRMDATWEPMAKAVRRVLRGMDPSVALGAAQAELNRVTAPPPAPSDPGPWLVLLAGLGVAGAFAALRSARQTQLRPWLFAYAWVGPAALGMLALVGIPFVVGASISLFSHRDGAFTFVGLSNYLDILTAKDLPLWAPQSFWYTLVVTVAWTLANVALHTGIGLGLALLLREPWVRLRGVFRALLILPWAVPNYITALTWKSMFHRQFGAVNSLLSAVGAEPVSWFGSFAAAFSANLATNTWLGFPFMMVVTLGALQSIPRELEQAAEVDGASAFQRFRHITLPLLMPALLPAVVLGSVWTFNMFNVVYLVSAGEPDGATEILVSEAYRWAFTRQHQYGYASAYAVLIFFVLFAWNRLGGRLKASA